MCREKVKIQLYNAILLQFLIICVMGVTIHSCYCKTHFATEYFCECDIHECEDDDSKKDSSFEDSHCYECIFSQDIPFTSISEQKIGKLFLTSRIILPDNNPQGKLTFISSYFPPPNQTPIVVKNCCFLN